MERRSQNAGTTTCTGATTPCTFHMGNAQQALTVTFNANTAPTAPTSLAQFKSNGTTSIATGGATNETTVVLKGTVSDPDAGNTVKLEVEVKPVGTAFNGSGTFSGSLVASGGTASATVTGLTNGTSYHWRTRSVDNNGTPSGGWVSFGGNAETVADFSVDTVEPPRRSSRSRRIRATTRRRRSRSVVPTPVVRVSRRSSARSTRVRTRSARPRIRRRR